MPSMSRRKNSQLVHVPCTHEKSMEKLPRALSLHFPALLLQKSAVDLDIVHMMRSFMNKGVRPNGFAEALLEFHTKEHARLFLLSEHENQKRKSMGHPKVPFSHFCDKLKYAGASPTRDTVARAYLLCHARIRPHLLDAEVKSVI
jgi:hypothetical protein